MSDTDPIVVVGMGPGGLVAAIEAAKKGHDVVLIENRNYFTRTQRVLLDKKVLSYLNKLYPGILTQQDNELSEQKKKFKAFLLSIRNSGNTVQVNELQEMLTEYIKHNHSDKVNIKMGRGHDIEAIDVDNQQIQLKTPHGEETIQFSHFIAADGARHSMTDKLNEAVKNRTDIRPIEYMNRVRQNRQEANGTVTLRYQGEGTPPIAGIRDLEIDDLPALEALGWQEPYPPKIYIFMNDNASQYYVAGEIPNKILNAPPDQRALLMEQWGQVCMSKMLGLKNTQNDFKLDIEQPVPGEEEKYEKINAMKATAFPVTLQYTETPCIKLPNNGAFVLVGDASKNANFHYGHGAGDAMNDALKAISSIKKDGSFDYDSYTNHQQSHYQNINMQMHQQRNSLQNMYAKADLRIEESIRKEAQILIGLADAWPEDDAILVAKNNLNKALSGESKLHDAVFTSTVELANALNQKAFQVQKDTGLRDKNIKHIKRDINFTKLSQEGLKVLGTVFNVVSKILPKIGERLQTYHQKQTKLVEQKIDELSQRKSNIIHQKNLTKPHELVRGKQRAQELRRPEPAPKSDKLKTKR